MRNRFARLAAAAALALLGGCRGMQSSRPPIHLNPNMDEQHRFDPQEANPLYADGRAMRTPMPGTVPFAPQADDALMLTGRGADGQLTSTLPPGVTLDRALLERGRNRYEVFCTPCHDVSGSGQGTVVARGFLPPPTFHDDRLRSMPIGHFYDVATHGIRNMPAYGPQIPVEDRWAIAAYVRVLQRSHMAARADVPVEVVSQKGWTE
jgi:mono/diheme cytochrome c family protein